MMHCAAKLFSDVRELGGDSSIDTLCRSAIILTSLQPFFIFIGAAVSDVALCLTVLCFIVHCVRTRSWAWVTLPWMKAAASLWGYYILRSFWAEVPMEALGKSVASLRFLLYATALSVWVLRVPIAQRLLLRMLIGAVIIAGSDALIQYATGTNMTGHEVIIGYAGSIRLTGFFRDPKIGIVMVWLAFPVVTVLYHAAMQRDGIRQWLWRALILGGFMACIFLTGERMAFLLALFGVLLWFLFSPSMRSSMKFIVPLVAIGGVAMAMLAPESVERQFHSTHEKIAQLPQSDYGVIWRSSLMMIEQHPLFGVGAKHFRSACLKERYNFQETPTEFPRCNLHPHHLYLEWLTEAGAVGLLLFLWMVWEIGRRVCHNVAVRLHNPLYLGLVIALAVRLWPLSTATSFFVTWSAIPFWLLLGWLLAYEDDHAS
ncbi:MAG: O-antigen ligase family protein [Alphaproteobacteria bacterium]|nr:MAG: O-antigen ligase family protein [Alphaproteobacteria bacterium]TAF77178.1 MAG: O-antigen ligase family protein [Alphaproteobacteria bacterium]